MKEIVLILFLLSSLAFKGQSQNSFDSLLKDLYIAPILYNPWEPKQYGINKDSARINKRLFYSKFI